MLRTSPSLIPYMVSVINVQGGPEPDPILPRVTFPRCFPARSPTNATLLRNARQVQMLGGLRLRLIMKSSLEGVASRWEATFMSDWW